MKQRLTTTLQILDQKSSLLQVPSYSRRLAPPGLWGVLCSDTLTFCYSCFDVWIHLGYTAEKKCSVKLSAISKYISNWVHKDGDLVLMELFNGTVLLSLLKGFRSTEKRTLETRGTDQISNTRRYSMSSETIKKIGFWYFKINVQCSFVSQFNNT